MNEIWVPTAQGYIVYDEDTMTVLRTLTRRATGLLVEGVDVGSGAGEYTIGNSGTEKTVDWNNGAQQRMLLSANCTVSFVAGYYRRTLLIVEQVGGFDITWDGDVHWSGGTPPVCTPDAGAVDLFTFARTASGIYLATRSLDHRAE